MKSIPAPYKRYLRLLEIHNAPSGLEGLRQIVHQHLCRVPFENISKLLLFRREKRGRPTTLAEFLDGIEHYDLGGTCYTSNPFLAGLLTALGYDAELLGADMASPNVHSCIRVRIGPESFHVDVGYAAPFREPISLSRLPHEIIEGGHRYVLDGHGCGERYEMSVHADGRGKHGYIVHGPPRSIVFFEPIILDSYLPGRTFMTQLRITRFFPDRAAEIRDRTLITNAGDAVCRSVLNNPAELRSAVRDQLAMPRCPVEEAIGVLEQLTGKRFFEDEGFTREPAW